MQQQGSRNRSKAHPIIRELPLDQLKRVLTEHRAWLDSDGKSGEKAGLSRAQLQGLSLWSADLREADLSYANLQGRLWITLACAAPTCGMQRWKVPCCGGLICGMQISATPPPASKVGPRRSFGCQSAQRRSHRSLTLGRLLSRARFGNAIGITDEQLKNARRGRTSMALHAAVELDNTSVFPPYLSAAGITRARPMNFSGSCGSLLTRTS